MRNRLSPRPIPGIVPLVEGKLFALGGTIPIDERISWLPKCAAGLYAPIQSYLLVENGSALLVDTGLPIHENVVLSQLHALLTPETPLAILHTRVGEYESVGNTAPIINQFSVHHAYGFFRPDTMMNFRSSALSARSQTVFEVKLAGDTLFVGDSGARDVTLLEAPLRIILTFWAYDAATKTLFTSDSFGHASLETPSSMRIIDETNDDTTLFTVREHLAAKFDWLSTADRVGIQPELTAVFETYDIETVAPMHGRILSGRSVVRRHLEMIQEALRTGWDNDSSKDADRATNAKARSVAS
jgi:flavorubredoxin